LIQEIYNEFIKSLRVKKIFVFGTGEYANNMKLEKIEVYSYVDNNAEKWGKFFKDRPIISPIELNQYINEDVFIIIASTFFLEIANQLINMGFDSAKHFLYYENIKTETAFENFCNLLEYKDIHKGKRAFLIGNGPSLKVEDLDKLQNEITFAANKIYLAYEQTKWRPTYYFALDRLFIESNYEQINNIDGKKFFIESDKDLLNNQNNVIWLEYAKTWIKYARVNDWWSVNNVPFTKDFSLVKETFGGATVIYTMLQLAYYMGINEVFLLGVDFNYKLPKLSDSINSKIFEGEGQNHFHPNYQQIGEKYNVPRLDIQYMVFPYAKQIFEADNRRIYNATRSTKLDIFQLVDFDEII